MPVLMFAKVPAFEREMLVIGCHCMSDTARSRYIECLFPFSQKNSKTIQTTPGFQTEYPRYHEEPKVSSGRDRGVEIH